MDHAITMRETGSPDSDFASPSFLDIVEETTARDSRLGSCIQCGTCSGSCPSALDMDYTPRALFQMIKAGEKEEVLSANTLWYCVSCYYCTVRCPQEVLITDIMYGLKRLAIQEGYFEESTARESADFSETYMDYVENYGRSFELGLATRHHLKHHPIGSVRKASLGLGLLRRGRIDLTPTRIKGIKQLQAILAKARTLGDGA